MRLESAQHKAFIEVTIMIIMITMMTKNLHDYDDYDHDHCLNESEEDTRWVGSRHLRIIIQSTTIVIITMIIPMIAPMTLVSTQVTEEGSVAAAATALLG